MRIGLWIVGCVALLQFCSQAQAAEKFERKYVENTERTKQTEGKVEQTLTIAGMNVETKATSFQVSKIVAGPRDADGNLPIEETVTTLQSDLELPGGLKLQFDSANPDKKADNDALNPILEIFRAILKSPLTTIVDRENKVKEVKIAGNSVDQLPKEYRSFLDPKRQQRDREQEWLFLPAAEVDAGAEWERFLDKDLGGGQTMNFKMKYVYDGTETRDGRACHKFTVQPLEVTYAMDPNVNPMIQVSNSDLKIEKSSGTILYDPATGETPLRDTTVTITGKLTLVINGQEFPTELDLTMSDKTTLQK